MSGQIVVVRQQSGVQSVAAGLVDGVSARANGAVGSGGVNETTALQNAHAAAATVLYDAPSGGAGGVFAVSSTITLGTTRATTHRFGRGARLKIMGTATVTLRGDIDAPDAWIFEIGPDATLLLPDVRGPIPLAWFGVKPGDVTFDNAPLILAAFKAAPGRRFLLGEGRFALLTLLLWKPSPPEGHVGTGFEEGPKLQGLGMQRTVLDCRTVAAGVEFDTEGANNFYFLRGVEVSDLAIESAASGAAALKVRHVHYSQFRRIRAAGFGRGFWCRCIEGDADGPVHLLLEDSQFENCPVWGWHFDPDPGRNEISFVTLRNVTSASCGTRDSSAISAVPVSGGGSWCGQNFYATNIAFSTCSEVDLFIRGQAGLANTFKADVVTSENPDKRHVVVTGVDNGSIGELQLYGNDSFRAGAGLVLDGSSYLVRNFFVGRPIVRRTNGARTVTFDGANNLVLLTGHNWNVGDAIVFDTDDTLPSGLPAAGVPVYVIASGLTANAARVSLTLGGGAIDIGVDGSGTHTAALLFTAFDAKGINVEFATVASPSWKQEPAHGVRFGTGIRTSLYRRLLDGGRDVVPTHGPDPIAVPFSATPVLDLSQSNAFEIGPMTANITSLTATGGTPGQEFSVQVTQDAVGSRTISWGSPFGLGSLSGTPQATANSVTIYKFKISAGGTARLLHASNWFGA